MSGVRGDTWTLLAWNSRTPTTTPTTISKQDSGKILLSFGVMWKPVNAYYRDLTLVQRSYVKWKERKKRETLLVVGHSGRMQTMVLLLTLVWRTARLELLFKPSVAGKLVSLSLVFGAPLFRWFGEVEISLDGVGCGCKYLLYCCIASVIIYTVES